MSIEIITISYPRENPDSPPTYQEATQAPTQDSPGAGVEPSVPPPSYDHLFGSVKQVRAESSGNVDFLCKVTQKTVGSVAIFGIFIAILLALPIAMIVIGSMYLNHCPIQKNIPVCLIAGGVVLVIKALSNIIQRSCKKKENEEGEDEDEEDYRKKMSRAAHYIINSVNLALFIAGCVFTYGAYSNDYQSKDPTADDYCNETVFMFAFWLLNAIWVLISFVFCLCCCCICLACCISDEE